MRELRKLIIELELGPLELAALVLKIAGLLTAELGAGTLEFVAIVPGPEKLLTVALELGKGLTRVSKA